MTTKTKTKPAIESIESILGRFEEMRKRFVTLFGPLDDGNLIADTKPAAEEMRTYIPGADDDTLIRFCSYQASHLSTLFHEGGAFDSALAALASALIGLHLGGKLDG